MEKKKRKFRKYIIISIVLIVLVGGYFYISSNAKKAMHSLSSSYVVESEVEMGNIETKLTGSGVIEPKTRVEIPKSVTGEVKSDYYQEGDEVKKDATLFKIEGMNIKSPIEGTLITKNASKGDYVSQSASTMPKTSSAATAEATSDPLAVVADISIMKVKLEVDEIEIGKVQLDTKAVITCDAVENREYEAKVVQIAAEGKSGNGVTTYDVTLEIANPEGLKIGMNADISMVVENKENVLRIPMDAINRDKKEMYVYVKDESYVADKKEEISFKVPSSMEEVKGYKKQTVVTGQSNKDYIEIVSGLEQGNKVYNISSSKSLIEYMMVQGTHSSM